MADRSIETEAIVLRRFDFSESSQVGHLFTLHEGRVSVLGKGIKKPNRSLKGPLDLFFRARVVYRRRPSTGLHLLTHYEPLSAWRPLRRNLNRLFAAFYVTELIYDGTLENDPSPEIYALLLRSMEALSQATGRSVPAIAAGTEFGYLKATGVMPTLESCARCDREAPAGSVEFFPLQGGVICRSCRGRAVGGGPGGESVRLDRGFRALLGAISQGGPDGAARVRMSPGQAGAMRSLMTALVQGALERRLSSAPFLENTLHGVRRSHLASAP